MAAVTGSSEAVEECLGENSPDSEAHMPLRANTTTQVCWHRTATVGMADMQAMLKVHWRNFCILDDIFSYSSLPRICSVSLFKLTSLFYFLET